MSAEKILLYPFSIESPYFDGYAWAVELSRRMNARLRLFISGGTAQENAPGKDSVYHSLLEAHGYYLQHYHQHGATLPEVKSEHLIAYGELCGELIKYLRNKHVDIVILDPNLFGRPFEGLKDIVRESGGVIMLPSAAPVPATTPTDHFYDHLRKAELYKLPRNFFSTLVNDRAGFNYLRKFFSKNRP